MTKEITPCICGDLDHKNHPTEAVVKHTPGQVRQAQDLAASLGHLNKCIPSLVDLYDSAPELLEVLEAAYAVEVLAPVDGFAPSWARAAKEAIAKAKGRGGQ